MPKILIIDDEVDLAKLTAKQLHAAGFEVSCYYRGEGAIEAVQSEHPDLVLLDIILPEISGWEIFKRLKKDKELKQIPVVFFSALLKTGSEDLAALGAQGSIGKPYDHAAFLAVIKKALAD